MKNLKLVDKYILKQLFETFILGVVVFTSIMFASDAFITIVSQVTKLGIPFKIAFLIIILKLPSIFVLTIPMGVLLATIITFNKLCTNSEISIMRSSGISLTRLALPVLIFGCITASITFLTNEIIAPVSNLQAKHLTLWALNQKNVPKGRANFSFKEMGKNNQVNRFFYISNTDKKQMQGITLLDMSKKGAIQIIQSKNGTTTPEYWNFNNGVIYTISDTGKTLNTTVFKDLKLYNKFELFDKYKKTRAKDLNLIQLSKYLLKNNETDDRKSLIIQLNEKLAIPFTCIFIGLIGVPLAITPPRAKINRGFLFSIVIIFLYYLVKETAISFGSIGVIPPVLAAWMSNIIIMIASLIMFYKKDYTV